MNPAAVKADKSQKARVRNAWRTVKFDSVNQFRATAAEVVSESDHILAIAGNIKSKIAIRTSRIIVSGNALTGGVIQIHHWIKATSNPSGITFNFVLLPLFRSKFKEVNVTWLLDNSIKRQRQFDR